MAGENTNPAFSPEQIEALNGLMGATVNNIFTARLGTLEKKILEKTTASLGEALKTQLPELLKELRPAPPVDDPDPKGKNKGGRQDDVELQTLRKQLEENRKNIEIANARAAAAEARRREMDRQKTLLEQLTKGGIKDAFQQELALAFLDRRKRVEWSGDDDDATLLWNDENGGQVSFTEGLTSWLKTDEAKHFLPPTGTKGAGSRPTQGGSPNTNQQLSPEQIARNLGEALDRSLA